MNGRFSAIARHLSAAAIVLISAVPVFARNAGKDADGHVLVAEWKKYGEAVQKDLPVTQEKILADILDKAEKRRLSWDFYDAAGKYAGVVRSRDWKRYGDVVDSLKQRITGYADPVVTWNFSDRYPFFLEAPAVSGTVSMKGLTEKVHSVFYANDRFLKETGVPEAIVGNIGNDYEYLLLSALMKASAYGSAYRDRDTSRTFQVAAEALKEYYSGRYPQAAYVEFVEASCMHRDSTELRKETLESFAEKYEGKGIRLLAWQELIKMKFASLEKSGASQEEYIALKKECGNFMKQMKSCGEPDLVSSCSYPGTLVEIMDSRHISAVVVPDTDTLLVSLRNLGEADILIQTLDSTDVSETTLVNAARSYYVEDTLKMLLPAVDDGRYRISCAGGDVRTSFIWGKYTLSMAWQIQSGGLAIYLADFMSGKPVTKADVDIYSRDSLVQHIPDVTFDGFTAVGARLPEQDTGYSVQCSYTGPDGLLRMTDRVYVWPGSPVPQEMPSVLKAVLLKDKAAFNPGDTLHFKATLYEKAADGAGKRTGTAFKVWTSDDPVVVELSDASGKTVVADTLQVNDFGSLSGRFLIPEDRTNGRFTLKVSHDGRVLASESVLVDEFILPSFTVDFEPAEEIWFAEDTVTLRGKVSSYGGQSLAAARASWTASLWGERLDGGTLELAPDGSFGISFVAGKGTGYLSHVVTLRITDATGETQEFSSQVAVNDFSFIVNLENDAEASMTPARGALRDAEADSADIYGLKALEGDFAVLSFALDMAGEKQPADVRIPYELSYKGQTVASGEAALDSKVWIDLSSWPSGVFRLEAAARVKGHEKTCVYYLVKTSEDDRLLDFRIENLFKVIPSGDISLQFGASDGPVWASVQLFGTGSECLRSEMVHLPGICSGEGSLKLLSYRFEDSYPDVVRMIVTYFRNGQEYTFNHDFKRKFSDYGLPLAFSRFTDRSFPGGRCIYGIQTMPGVECAVSVFDKASEAIAPEIWSRVLPYVALPYVRGFSSDGYISGGGSSREIYAGYGDDGSRMFRLTSAVPLPDNSVAVEEYAGDKPMLKGAVAGTLLDTGDVTVREDFSRTLAFYPFLRSDEDGRISFEFTAGDKLSTYVVSLFAHDKSMKNNVLRKDMFVYLPVSVSVVEPAFLYSGDDYDISVALSNVSEKDSEGTLAVYVYEGARHEEVSPAMVMSRPASVGAGSASSGTFSIEVPSGIDTLGLKIIYSASDGVSDGVFVTIPVHAPVQTLYESHSSLLLPGMSEDSLYRALRDEFVNVSGYGAESREISIADMLEEAIPENIRLHSADVISVAGSYVASRLAHLMDGEEDLCPECGRLEKELLSYRNAGGGFAWLKGGKSSPVVTAVVLEYISTLGRKGLVADSPALVKAASEAVSYLDRYYFSADRLSVWAGDITMPQYLYIRSLYATEPLGAKPDRKTLKAFSKECRDYLRGNDEPAPGQILHKARRAATLLNFLRSGDSGYLASVKVKCNSRLRTSLRKAMTSLKEYAVDHRSGGKYYPNAVLPFRGLLESELYAHSLLCRLFADYGACASDVEASAVADGIRLWIMVQKETQDWGEDPAFMLALDAVSEASAGLLSAKVLVLTGKYEKPFPEIKAAGNDVSVRCRYFVEDASAAGGDVEIAGYRELKEGERLRTGDKVLAVYDLWSAENRSFVRLTAPRYPSLRPENQISGIYGFPFRTGRFFAPYSYREVKSDRSIWYMDVLAEEDTRVMETLVVTQSGEFSCPAAVLECMYAPHYRANGDALPKLVSGR